MDEIDSANGSKPAADASERTSKHKGAKKAKSTKKGRAAKETTTKPFALLRSLPNKKVRRDDCSDRGDKDRKEFSR
jgi:hypothetical protein